MLEYIGRKFECTEIGEASSLKIALEGMLARGEEVVCAYETAERGTFVVFTDRRVILVRIGGKKREYTVIRYSQIIGYTIETENRFSEGNICLVELSVHDFDTRTVFSFRDSKSAPKISRAIEERREAYTNEGTQG